MVKQKGKKNYIQKNFIIRKKHYNFIKVEGGNPQKKMENRFSVQIKNNGDKFKTLYGFEMNKDKVNLVELTKEDFNTKYIIDEPNDTHKCIVPVLKRIKDGKD